MQDNYYTGDDARTKLFAGVNKVVDVAKLTLGAAGSNAVIQRGVYPGHEVTNDGISIIDSIVLADPVENIGANLVKENSTRSNKESGDGTTTAAVLLQAILKEGMNVEALPMEIKRSLDECVPIVLKAIDDQTKPITPEEVGQVATVSSEDEEMGKLFQDIYKQIGKDGIVELDTSGLPETYFEITEGVRLRNAGYLGAYSTTEAGKAIYKNPKVLVTRDKIASIDQLEPLVKALVGAGINELVIYAEEIDLSVATQLAATHLKGAFKTLLIKAPTLWKDWIIEDLAAITGATLLDSKEGRPLKSMQMSDLGTCDKIITTKDETRVYGIKDITEYVKRITEQGTDDSKIHAAWLQTKAAILKLGASTETELSYKRLKAEDARNAAYYALQGGVVAGGGVCLRNVMKALPDTIGGIILTKAVSAPIRQIIENAGGKDTCSDHAEPDTLGFNARTGEVVDMWEAGIIDPALIVKNAIRNAISIAGTVLTAKIVITQPTQP